MKKKSNVDNVSISSSLIKTEETDCSSSSNNNVATMGDSSTTASATDGNTSYAGDGSVTTNMCRVKKEEEVYNNHNDDDDDDDDDSNNDVGNCNLNRAMVKKEEEEEEEEEEGENDNETAPTPESSSNDDYSDWKKGNWCWLLPATITNNDSIIIKNETRENDIVCTTCVTHHSAKSEDDDGGTNSNTANSATTTNGITVIAATSTTKYPARGIKMGRRSMTHDDDDDDDDNGKKPPPKKKIKHYHRPINATVKEEEDDEDEDDEEEEEEINADEINADEASKTPTNDNDKDKDNNGDDEEEGYESWTEGNWCRLLPVAIETTGPSTKSRRNHKFSHQHYFEGDDDNNSGDEDYIADDDDAKNGSSAKAKTKGKSIKIGYTRLQNDRWNEMFQRLVAYKKNHRSLYTCLTPTPNRYAEDPQLGDWVMKQRRCYKNTEISVERIRRLDYIGFVWKIKEHVPWMEMYQRLVVYKNRHKSINIPSKYADDPKLAKWVNNQRGSYTKNGLSIERINLLESIGFVWDRSDAQWMGMYSKLVAYKKQNKSTQVPIYYTEPLRKWVCTQRRSNKCDKARLSEKRLQLLNSINFAWSVRKDDGDEKTAATTTKTNREPWETSEDKKLVKLVQKTTHKTKNVFVDIARQIEGKDWIQCKYRWYCIKKDIPVVKVKPSNKPWDSREDRKLIRLVNKMTHTFATTTTTATNIYCKDFEEKNLDLEEIAHQFKGKRTSRQCINRWDFIKKRSAVAEAAAAEIAAVAIAGGGGGGHGIDDHPNKKPPPPSNNDRHNNWTTTEDNALNVLVDAYGKEWTEITKYMPGREEDAIKKRWNYIGTTWSKLEDNKLKKLFQTYGKVREKWAIIIKNMPGRSKTALEVRWYGRLKKEVEAEAAEEEDSNTAMLSSTPTSSVDEKASSKTNVSLDLVMEEWNDDSEQEQEQECSSIKSYHYQPDNSLLKKLTPHSTKVMAKEVVNKKRWTDAEDIIFFQRVQKYTGLDKNWAEIASHIEGKTPKQCIGHWYNILKKYKKK